MLRKPHTFSLSTLFFMLVVSASACTHDFVEEEEQYYQGEKISVDSLLVQVLDTILTKKIDTVYICSNKDTIGFVVDTTYVQEIDTVWVCIPDNIIANRYDKYGLLSVAHWNIGHFAMGKNANTTIKSSEAAYWAEQYRVFFNFVNADVIGICEYNPTFSSAGENTAQELFASYPYQYIGKKYAYNCNSIFSRIPLHSEHQVSFANYIQHRYYTVTDIYIKGERVKFVETHLDWNQGQFGAVYRALQMQELVNIFEKDSYVIICADFNSSTRAEYDVFKEAGYTLATDSLWNRGSISNDISKVMIDNIIVKGLKIIKTNVYQTNSLSDHNLIRSTLLLTWN